MFSVASRMPTVVSSAISFMRAIREIISVFIADTLPYDWPAFSVANRSEIVKAANSLAEF